MYFPKGSSAFVAACAEGIFEWDNVRLLQALASPNTWFFDVGANIGLMSVPMLQYSRELRVGAFEPSPNSLPSLTRTISESRYRDRWTLFPLALGASRGRTTFSLCSREEGMFDGVKSTGRQCCVGTVEVEQKTLDSVWVELGRPTVSAVKCDVEGAELDVLGGALELLTACRPYLLLEWQKQNLKAYDVAPEALLAFACNGGFSVLAVPRLIEIKSARELDLHMASTESFLLSPK